VAAHCFISDSYLLVILIVKFVIVLEPFCCDIYSLQVLVMRWLANLYVDAWLIKLMHINPVVFCSDLSMVLSRRTMPSASCPTRLAALSCWDLASRTLKTVNDLISVDFLRWQSWSSTLKLVQLFFPFLAIY